MGTKKFETAEKRKKIHLRTVNETNSSGRENKQHYQTYVLLQFINIYYTPLNRAEEK